MAPCYLLSSIIYPQFFVCTGSKETELFGVVARGQRVVAVRSGPLGARSSPVAARHDHMAVRVEGDALGLEQLALKQTARADGTFFRHDPLPGQVAALRRHV